MGGVINLITKSPWELAGTNVQLGAGEKGTLFGSVSYASGSEATGFKIGGSYFEQDPFDRPTGLIPGKTTPYPPFRNGGTKQPKLDLRVDHNMGDGDQILSFSAGTAATDGIVHSGIGPFDVSSSSHLDYGKLSWSKGALNVNFFANLLDGKATNLLTVGLDGRPPRLPLQEPDLQRRPGRRPLARHQPGDLRRQLPAHQLRPVDRPLGRRPQGVRPLPAGRDRVLRAPQVAGRRPFRRHRPDRLGGLAAHQPALLAQSEPQLPDFLQQGVPRSVAGRELPRHRDRQRDHLAGGRPVRVPHRLAGQPQPDRREADLLRGGLRRHLQQQGRPSPWRSTATSGKTRPTSTPPSTTPPPTRPRAGRCRRSSSASRRSPAPCRRCSPTATSARRSTRASRFRSTSGPRPTWRFNINYSYQDKPEVTGIDPDEINLPPKNRFNLGIGYNAEKFFADVQVNYVDEAFWTDVLDSRFWGPTDEYTSLNLTLGYHFNDHVTFSVVGNNVTDERIQQHVFGDIISRRVTGNLRLAF